jgi:regulator of protease activity HflC (stomatin/prohibitin superfamily)
VTADGLTIEVDGVVFFKVHDALSTVFGVTDYIDAVSTLAQTKLREVNTFFNWYS